jgi:DNA-binding Lrp family transcriptional regulator
MNSWKLNSTAGYWFRLAISKSLNIHFTEVYRKVKSINNEGVIETSDGKKYELILKELL